MNVQNIKVNNNQIIGIDDEPTAGSDNMVKSNGVYNEIDILKNNGGYDKEAEYDFERSVENAFSSIIQITTDEPLLDVYPSLNGVLNNGIPVSYHTRVFTLPVYSKGKSLRWAGGQLTFVYALPESYEVGVRLRRVTPRLQSGIDGYTSFTIPSNATHVLISGQSVPTTLSVYSNLKNRIVQETGNSGDRVMSQKAVTDKFNDIQRIHQSNYDFVKSINNDLYSQYGNFISLSSLTQLDVYPSSDGVLVDGTSLGYHSKYVSLTPSMLAKQVLTDESLQLVFVYSTPTAFERNVKLSMIDGRKTPQGPTAYTIPTNAVGMFISAYTIPDGVFLQSSRLKESIEEFAVNIVKKFAPMSDIGYLRFDEGTEDRYLWEEKKLQDIGDYLEFNYAKGDGTAYSFAGFLANNSSLIGITVVRGAQSIRTNLGNWVILNQSNPYGSENCRVRFEIVEGGIAVKKDGVQVAMYEYTFAEGEYISINGYGAPADSQYPNTGQAVGNVVINGEDIDLPVVYKPYGYLSKDQYNKLYEGECEAVSPQMMISKIANGDVYLYQKTGGNTYIEIPIKKRYKAYSPEASYPYFYDNYGVLIPRHVRIINGNVTEIRPLFQGGETELAISVPNSQGTSEYVGGAAHGSETIIEQTIDNVTTRQVYLMVNGVKYTEADEIPLQEIQSFEMFQNSNLFQSGTQNNPFATVLKHWVLDEKKLHIYSEITCLRDISVGSCQIAMFCVLRDNPNGDGKITNTIIKSNKLFEPYDVSNPSSIGQDNNTDYFLSYGNIGYGFKFEASSSKGGGMFFTNNGTGAYNKQYRNIGPFKFVAGEVVKSEQHWTLEYTLTE